MKKRKIDKKVFSKMIIILLLIGIIIALIQITRTAARYASKVSAEKQVDVAMYVMDSSFKDDTRLILEDLLPSDTAYEYTFSVSNNNGTKRTDVNMEYDIVITATTNMPLTYSIEKDGAPCEATETIIKEESGESYTYYKQIILTSEDNNLKFSHTEDKTDEFVIKVKFPKGYSTQDGYADLIENVRLEVTGRQIIE